MTYSVELIDRGYSSLSYLVADKVVISRAGPEGMKLWLLPDKEPYVFDEVGSGWPLDTIITVRLIACGELLMSATAREIMEGTKWKN